VCNVVGVRTLKYQLGFLAAAALLALVLPWGIPVAQETDQDPIPHPAEDRAGARYRIGVDDRLRIHVWEDEDLRGGTELVVRPDGLISFAYIQDLQAAGLTPSELQEDVREKIAPFVPDASVTVFVEEINSFKVYVIGEVDAQGMYQVHSRLRVLQVLALAGGLTDFADKDRIILVREVDGKEVRLRLNYRKILAGEEGQNVWIRPGDTLIVF
jgi:polysaccharide export outer membrane protein